MFADEIRAKRQRIIEELVSNALITVEKTFETHPTSLSRYFELKDLGVDNILEVGISQKEFDREFKKKLHEEGLSFSRESREEEVDHFLIGIIGS